MFEEISIIVERKGYGPSVWRWRLSNGSRDLAASTRGFQCAEDAYGEGQANLAMLRASDVRPVRRLTETASDEDIESFDFALEA